VKLADKPLPAAQISGDGSQRNAFVRGPVGFDADRGKPWSWRENTIWRCFTHD
jgi:hypothetical protein